MSDHRTRFLQLALEADALRFGQFTLKSGRVSPYFFNAGRFDSGARLAGLAACYADAVDEAGLDFDLVFGPAYKGIPLATALVCEYARRGRDLPLAFNRKEAKDHGEGGSIVGSPLEGRVLVVDDVITAGTAIREVMGIIDAAGARAAGVVVALDREERGQGELSAIGEIREAYGIPVHSIVALRQIVDYLEQQDDAQLREHLPALKAYREQYGVA